LAVAFAAQHGPSGQQAPSGQQLAWAQHACGGSQQSAPGVQQDTGEVIAQHDPPSHPPDFGAVATPHAAALPASNTAPITFVHMVYLPFG